MSVDVRDRDGLTVKTHWTCEKWSEEACDYARKVLLSRGIETVEGPLQYARTLLHPRGIIRPQLVPIREYVPSHVLRAIVGSPEEALEVPGNLLVNEGIQRLLDLAIAAVNNQTAGNAWNNGSSFIGVGDTSTAEAATQTELLAAAAATNRFYKAMNATFPSRTNQTVTWQSDFATGEANFAWNEWTVAAGATGASGSGFLTGTVNLNRKVSSLGTKASGTWTLSAQVTVS